MKRNGTSLAVFFAIVVCGASSSAFADESKSAKGDSKATSEQKAANRNKNPKAANTQAPRTKNESAQKPQVSPNKQSSKPSEKVKSGKEPSPKRNQTEARFVDRDGDGLRDGEERRFRRRYRHGGSSEAAPSQPVLRFRHRYGAQGRTTHCPKCQ